MTIVDANGFRLLDEAGPDVLLDFLDCSDEGFATVVARVRVRSDRIAQLLVQLREAAPDMAAGDSLTMFQAEFQRGQFQAFRATTRIHIGTIQKDIDQDEIVEYDGSQCKYNGETFAMPQMRAAIKANWFVPEIDQETVYKAQPANITLRPAQTASNERGEAFKVETATEDSNVVGSLDASKRARDEALRVAVDPRAVESRRQERAAMAEGRTVAAVRGIERDRDLSQIIPDDMDPNDPELLEAARLYQEAIARSRAKQAGMPLPAVQTATRPTAKPAPGPIPASNSAKPFKATVVKGDEDSADARPVKKVTFSNKQNTVLTDASSVDREIARLTDPNGNAAPRAVKAGARVLPSDEQVHEALPIKPKFQSTLVTEGTSIKARKGDATGDVGEAVSSDDLSDLVPDAATASAPVKIPGMTQGFKNSSVEKWDKTRPITVRINDAINNHSHDSAAMELIIAQESPGVASQLRAALTGK